MPSQSPHWTLFDSDPLSNSDFHHFTQPFNRNKAQGFFVIAAEHLSVGNENRSVASRSIRGAELAIEAARLTFSEIVENELNFSKVFLTLFSKQWKAATLLDAVKDTDTKSSPLAIGQLSDTAKTTDEQQEILALYDPSIALFYQSEKQLMFLSLGDTQIALVNRRYHCEIKESTQVSLSKLLVDLENGAESPFQFIDIEEYQLEMVALLSHRYTTSKTMARLHSNMIKRYRQLESKNSRAESTDNSYLLLFKKKQANPISTEPQIVASDQLKIERDSPKKSMATLILSLFALLTVTASSYFFWQAQATETELSTLVESKPQESPKAQPNTQIILNNHQEDALKSAKETLRAEEKARQEEIKKQQAQQIKALQQQEQEAIALKQQNDLRLKIQQVQSEALKKQEEQIRKKAEAAKAEKLRLIEEKAHIKQKELLKQQQALELAKAKEEQKEKRLKAEKLAREKLAREKQERAQLLLIEQDIERMNQQEEEIRAQKEAEQKKRKEEQLRVRKIELEQERKKREQLAKIEAEKRAEDKRLEALVRQRRLEFEANKAKQRLEFENNKIRQQREKEKAINPLADVTPTKPEESGKPQDITKSNAAEKKRNMLAELKRQKQSQLKAKTDKLRLKQKTAIHQLVNYSKTFNRHTTQLKQKLDRLAAIDQRSDAFTNKALIHKRKLLKGKEAVIRARLDSIAGMYLAKLRLVCAKEKIFPVSTIASNKTERIARKVISHHVSNCSQAQSLSASRISATLLDKYLK